MNAAEELCRRASEKASSKAEANPAFAKRPRTGGGCAEKQQQPEMEGGASSPAAQRAKEIE